MTMQADDDTIELDMDYPVDATRQAHEAAVATDDSIQLDMTDPGQTRCVDCGATGSINDAGRCRGCASDDVTSALGGISSESTANAAAAGIGSLSGGQMGYVGFNSKDGYIQAIRNGVPAHTHASYLTTLRIRYGLTSADLAALELPGPMVASALPVGDGIVHRPAGHTDGSAGIFERPAAARQFKVGDAGVEYAEIKPADLKTEKLVAVARSEGHGVVIAWAGRRSITRSALSEALYKIGAYDLLPKANSAHAQAGRTVGALNALGYVVRIERKIAPKAGETGPTYDARWTIGRVNHDAMAGETLVADPSTGETAQKAALGTRILQVTLTDGVLSYSGDQQLAASIESGYQERIGSELYQSADLTGWLGGVLRKEFKAVQFGAMGWYVPPKHAARAGEICKAVADTGFGAGWVLPGLPVTDSDHLRDGILRGLTDEVDGLMERLASERETAKATNKRSDIGPRRAETYIKDLRKISERVVAYGVVLGDDRVASAKATIHSALQELETIRGGDATVERFRLIWEEIEHDAERSGAAL